MITINPDNLEVILENHYQSLKNKMKEGEFPHAKYSLEEVIKAKPDILYEIAEWSVSDSNTIDYKFMLKEYKKFTTKKKEYDAYILADNLNINICPYCNINSTYTVIQKDGKKIIRPEFDHFYDKSTYPILALSFYNLIPSCHSCNSTFKGDLDFIESRHLHPYQDSFNEYVKFKLKIKHSNFYHSEQGFEITIDLLKQSELAKNTIETFNITPIYQKHKNSVLDIIQKISIYNESYMEELLKEYEGIIFKNREDLQRLLFGAAIDGSELHVRPLSKLIKDISFELGLD